MSSLSHPDSKSTPKLILPSSRIQKLRTLSDRVIRGVAASHRIPALALLGRSQRSQIVAARRDAAKQLLSLGFSYPMIGRALGGRHHTTIMNLCGRPGVYERNNPVGLPAEPDPTDEWSNLP